MSAHGQGRGFLRRPYRPDRRTALDGVGEMAALAPGLGVLLPDGWAARRVSDRRWWVHAPDGSERPAARFVAELVWLHSDEWALIPAGEVLPWPRAHRSAASALDELVAWFTCLPRHAAEPADDAAGPTGESPT